MDVDLSALKALERDKEISMEVLLAALTDALVNAYAHTPGAIEGARVEIDRKTGKVSVLAPELDEEGNRIGEYDHTPEGFGRVAAATARQVIFQRLREAEDEQKYGHFAGVEGDIVLGIVQQDRDSRTVRVDLGPIEAIMPPAEQVPVRTTPTASGCGSTWSASAANCAGRRWWSPGPIRTWWPSCSGSRFPRSSPASSRSWRSLARPAIGPRSL